MNERLTSPASTTYARGGELFMASENTKDHENKSWDPIETPLNTEGVRTPQATSPLESAARAFFYEQMRQSQGGRQLSDAEKGAIDAMVASGAMPPQFGGARGTERAARNDRNRRGSRRQRDDEPINESLESLRASNIDLESDDVRRETIRGLYEQVNRVDSLNYAELQFLSDQLDDFSRTNLFEDPERLQEMISTVGQALLYAGLEETARDQLARQGVPNPPRELVEQTMEQLRPAKKPVDTIRDLKNNILERSNQIPDPQQRFADMRDNFIWLKRYVGTINENAASGSLELQDATKARLAAIIERDPGAMSEDEIKETTHWLTEVGPDSFNMQQYFTQSASVDRKRGRALIQSLEDLVDVIVEAQDHNFATGQKFEILNKRGEIVKENLIAWIRSSIVKLHESDPDNPINPFTSIVIPTALRDINFNTIVNTPAYFQKRKMIITGKEGAGGKVDYINSADSEYTALKDAMLFEAWLFGISHSNDATYRQVAGSESELFSALSKIYSTDIFTKNDRIERHILRFAKTDRPADGGKSEFQEFLDDQEQGSVGKTIQNSLVAYYYMAELAAKDKAQESSSVKNAKKAYEAAKTPEAKDAALVGLSDVDKEKIRLGTEEEEGIDASENPFYRAMGEDGMNYFWQSIAETMVGGAYKDGLSKTLHNFTPGKEEEDFEDARKVLSHPDLYDEFFAESGGKYKLTRADLDLYQSDPRLLALRLMSNINGWKKKDLNIFDKVDKNKQLQDMVHKAISNATARKNGLSRTDTIYAGLWSKSFVYWTGISARNDIDGIGFDAWSKLLNFGTYRLRQANERSGAGNLFTMPGLKRIGLTMFDGMVVNADYDPTKPRTREEQMRDRTFMEMLQGGQGNEIHLDKFERFHFKGDRASRQFAANHITNAKMFMDFVFDKMEIHLADLFKKDPGTGSLIFDHNKARELYDVLWKNIRYAFDQQRFVYDAKMWDWEQIVKLDEKTGKPVITDGKVEKTTVFDNRKVREHMFGNEIIHLDMYHQDNHQPPKDKIGKNVFAYLIAKEILAHRRYGTGYDRWSITDIQAVQHFFEHTAKEVLIHPDKNGEMVEIEAIAGFFNHHEWNHILGLIKSSYGKMWTIEGLLQLAGSLVGGVMDAGVATGKQVTKIQV